MLLPAISSWVKTTLTDPEFTSVSFRLQLARFSHFLKVGQYYQYFNLFTLEISPLGSLLSGIVHSFPFLFSYRISSSSVSHSIVPAQSNHVSWGYGRKTYFGPLPHTTKYKTLSVEYPHQFYNCSKGSSWCMSIRRTTACSREFPSLWYVRLWGVYFKRLQLVLGWGVVLCGNRDKSWILYMFSLCSIILTKPLAPLGNF